MGNRNLAAYLVFMAPRLVELHRVLKPSGCFFLHCDDSAVHHLGVLLDIIYGEDLRQPPIVWKRSSAHTDRKAGFGRVHDTILWYCKDNIFRTNPPDETCITDVPPLNAQSKKRTGYPTQKPVELLQRLFGLAIAPNGTVLDCFCGSGTTLMAAQQVGMRWIGIDLSELAIAAERLSREFPGAPFCRTSESQPGR